LAAPKPLSKRQLEHIINLILKVKARMPTHGTSMSGAW
jgi:hypothetical protein